MRFLLLPAIAKRGLRIRCVSTSPRTEQAARELGIEAVEMIAPLAPGAPLCRAHAPGTVVHGLEVNVKGGQVGAPDYFGTAGQQQI